MDIEILNKYNQEHLLKFFDKLSQEQKDKLTNDINKVDFELLKKLITIYKDSGKPKKNIIPEPDDVYQPKKHSFAELNQIKSIGNETLQRGEVCFFVVAGGQGSRLGYDKPKGEFPISPIKNKSLFQIHSEKIKAINDYYKTNMPFIIMTSEVNNDDTIKFFENNNFFGLNKNDIFFIKQGVLPAIDFDGKIILKDKDSIFFSPDGHGGSLKTLNTNVTDILLDRGIKILSYFQVDNPLVHIADPLFIGLHVKSKSQMSNKVLKKRDPLEKVGVVCKINGKNSIIEYSDLDDKYAFQKDNSGELVYGFGSIAIHLFDLEFIKTFENDIELPYHIAKKSIQQLNSLGEIIKPENPNGIKFEQFVFDALPFAKKTLNFETFREIDFAPLKNKSGEDSIDTCKQSQIELFKLWLKQASINYNDSIKLEISPTFAFSEDIFLEKKDQIKNDFSKDCYLD